MFYKRFTVQLLLRMVFINIVAIFLIYLIRNTQLWFTIAGTALLLLSSLISCYFYLNKTREDIKRFILAIKMKDNTVNFKNKAASSSFPELYESFNDILQVHKDVYLEKDAMFQLIKTILEQMPVGVIVLKKETLNSPNAEIVFFNVAASNLLQVPAYKYWHRLKNRMPAFTLAVEAIKDGGKKFIELKALDKQIQLSIEVIPLNLYATDYLIVSFQNIKDEIEQKEAEVWNRLIGVISHEILNSITPISSLSDTAYHMVAEKDLLAGEDLDDLRPALLTIKKRSEGLLDFVKDYRLIAELPSPRLQAHTIGDLLKQIKTLMAPFVTEKNILLKIEQTSSRITVDLDLKLIEQSLINLVTNSIYALEGIDQPYIEINYRLDQNKLFLEVSDNGKGIEPDLMEKVFVPFFTTRKNGSGIGLTITRNIMKMHQGSLEVSSIPFERTTFSLVFKYT